MMTKREIMDKVGPMDEKYKLYFEDVDWCRRFWENGYKVVYYPEAQMYHYHRRGSAGKGILNLVLFNKLTRLHIQSAIKYFLKYAGKKLPAHKISLNFSILATLTMRLELRWNKISQK